MELSHAGVLDIASSEGWSPVPYWDPYGKVYTAYFGETDGITEHSPRRTMAEGYVRLKRIFMDRYSWALKPFEKLRGFNQNMYDALASFIWNCGTGAVSSTTTVGRLLRARKWNAAAHAFLAWCKAGGQVLPGLRARRVREMKTFLKKVKAKLRPIRLTKTERGYVQTLIRQRQIADRHGGWDKIDGGHERLASDAKAWLRLHATALAGTKAKDKRYQARKVDYLRDVAFDRGGRGR